MHATAFANEKVSQHFRADIRPSESFLQQVNHILIQSKFVIYNPVICYLIINLWNAHDADVFPRWIQHLSEDVAPWKSKIHCRARDFEQFCKFFSPVSNRKISITVQEVILHKMTNSLNGSIFNHCFHRFIESRIASQNQQIFMKSSEIFGCCRFSARFWTHSTQMWKCCCRQSINIRTTRWWQVRRKAIGYASRIGCVICQRIKLATLSMVTFHMFWMVIQSCASLKTCPSKICILIFFPRLYDVDLLSCLNTQIEPFVSIDRNSIVDFKDYLESAFEGIPPYGDVFVVELNQKFLRAIRIDSEVSWNHCFVSVVFIIFETMS